MFFFVLQYGRVDAFKDGDQNGPITGLFFSLVLSCLRLDPREPLLPHPHSSIHSHGTSP
jgi:hypothetical protein